jgi:hypothetical protein
MDWLGTIFLLPPHRWSDRGLRPDHRLPPPIVMAGDSRLADVPALAGPGTPAAEGAAPAGPPPEFLALSTKAGRGGQFILLMLFVIVALIVFKPNF